METVGDILRAKGRQVWTVRPDDTVLTALTRMAQREVGAVVVVDGERIVGILSERDYARKVILRGKSSRDTPVWEIMTRDVVFTRPEHTVRECMGLFTEHRVRHLPVLEAGKLAGIISIGDVVKAIIDEQAYEIDELEHYIRGS
jgi:CBS domain-containing protein